MGMEMQLDMENSMDKYMLHGLGHEAWTWTTGHAAWTRTFGHAAWT
jgi:hypothetical protein